MWYRSAALIGVTDLAVPGAASLADSRMVFPADLAEKVTIDVAGLVGAGTVSLADAEKMFPAVSAERVTMDVADLTDEVHVNVVGVPTCTSWGDRLSPGVWCRDRKLIKKNFDFRPDDSMRCDWDDTDGSGPTGALETLLCDPG